MHEGVEGVVEGVHEVGVVDWGLGAWKGGGVEREEELQGRSCKRRVVREEEL